MGLRIDFSSKKLSGIHYGGADEKIGIICDDGPYMLKFAKGTVFGISDSDIIEDLCCKIFTFLGFKTQVTFLGVYKKRRVVACKDMFYKTPFRPFDALGESSIESRGSYTYSYSDIVRLIDTSSRFVDATEIRSVFFKTYIVDALLANSDRHGKNWGFIDNGGVFEVAPIFDTANCLFSSLIDEGELKFICESEEEILERVYERPSSLIQLSGSVSNYYDVIHSKSIDELNKALIEIFPTIDIDKIIEMIEESELSPFKKKFLRIIVRERYCRILKKTYDELIDNHG